MTKLFQSTRCYVSAAQHSYTSRIGIAGGVIFHDTCGVAPHAAAEGVPHTRSLSIASPAPAPPTTLTASTAPPPRPPRPPPTTPTAHHAHHTHRPPRPPRTRHIHLTCAATQRDKRREQCDRREAVGAEPPCGGEHRRVMLRVLPHHALRGSGGGCPPQQQQQRAVCHTHSCPSVDREAAATSRHACAPITRHHEAITRAIVIATMPNIHGKTNQPKRPPIHTTSPPAHITGPSPAGPASAAPPARSRASTS